MRIQCPNINEGGKSEMIEIFTPYITKNGRRIYRKNGKYFHFFVDERKRRRTSR